MPRRLDISVRPDGTITAEASGTPGPDCLDSLDQLRAILNADIAESKPTPEFSEQRMGANNKGSQETHYYGEDHENA